MNYTEQEIRDIEKLEALKQEYLREIEPFVKMRVDLSLYYNRMYIDDKGIVHHSYEPKVQFIDDQLKHHIELDSYKISKVLERNHINLLIGDDKQVIEMIKLIIENKNGAVA